MSLSDLHRCELRFRDGRLLAPYPWKFLRLKAELAPELTWITKSGRECRCWRLRPLSMAETGEGVPLPNGTM